MTGIFYNPPCLSLIRGIFAFLLIPVKLNRNPFCVVLKLSHVKEMYMTPLNSIASSISVVKNNELLVRRVLLFQVFKCRIRPLENN